jgi:hypothetical protein
LNSRQTCLFSLCGLSISLKVQEPEQGEQLKALWQQVFAVTQIDRPVAPSLTFQVMPPGTSLVEPGPGEQIFRSPNMRILQTGYGYHLQTGPATLSLDLDHRTNVCVITSGFWDLPLQYQRDFFLSALLLLLRHQGVYGLHANGLERHGRGALLVGESGSGKTTLALALVRAGWRYISDDVLALRRGPEGIEALALRRGFAINKEIEACFPELVSPGVARHPLNDGKELAVLDDLFPDQFTPSCSPSVLVFPEITGDRRSQLLELKDAGAMAAMIRPSLGIMVDRELAARQLEITRQLVAQSRSYRLFVGRDVYESPSPLSQMLIEAGQG